MGVWKKAPTADGSVVSAFVSVVWSVTERVGLVPPKSIPRLLRLVIGPETPETALNARLRSSSDHWGTSWLFERTADVTVPSALVLMVVIAPMSLWSVL